MKRLIKFWKRSAAERGILIGALFWLAVVRVGLWALPLKRVLARLESLQTSEVFKTSEVSPKQIAWAVRSANRFISGGENCLAQALAGRVMLARRGYASQLRIGSTRDASGQFKAHAWVEYNGRILIGASGVSRYTPFPNLEMPRP